VGCLAMQGRYAEAQQALDRLLELDPDFVPAIRAQADLYSRQGRFDLEIEWLLRASNLDPDNFSTYFDLVWTFLDLDDEAAIERLRDVMVQRVDEDHLNIAWLDAMASMGEGNPGAALEHVAWIFEKMGRLPYVKSIEGYLHNHRGDAARARAAFEVYDPRLFDPEQWRKGIVDHPRDACLAGWMLINTGEQAKGEALLQDAVRYLEDQLPQYVDRAKNWGVEECFVIQGDIQAALDVIEWRFENDHLTGWHFYEKQPHYAPLLREPRFQALNRQRLAIMAEQRAAITALDFGESGP
jgi:tetratricopeptide (TPR) repeat protein